jgi:hypothetical protein
MFGEVALVPMATIFSDIEKHLEESSVQLPSERLKKEEHQSQPLHTPVALGVPEEVLQDSAQTNSTSHPQTSAIQREKPLSTDHTDHADSKYSLSDTFIAAQENYKEEQDSLSTRQQEKIMHAEYLDALTNMEKLALTYRNQGRWMEAEEQDEQVMITTSRILGLKHAHTLISVGNLASTYRNQGRWKDAEELDVKLVETFKNTMGVEHPDTLTSMNNLSVTYKNQGRWEEAEALNVQVLETRTRKLGANHPDTLVTMNNLAHIWKAQKKHEEALAMMEKCVDVCFVLLGSSHPTTVKMSESYKSWKLLEVTNT